MPAGSDPAVSVPAVLPLAMPSAMRCTFGAAQIAGREGADKWHDMAGDPPLIYCHGGRPLRPLEPSHDQPGARRVEIFVAQLADGQRVARLAFLPLRISPFGGSPDDVLCAFSGSLDGVGAIGADFDAALKAPDADLSDEHLFAARVDPQAEPCQIGAPDEISLDARFGGSTARFVSAGIDPPVCVWEAHGKQLTAVYANSMRAIKLQSTDYEGIWKLAETSGSKLAYVTS